MRRTLALSSLALVASLALTGCTLGFTPADDGATAAAEKPAAEKPATDTAGEGTTAPDTAPTPDAAQTETETGAGGIAGDALAKLRDQAKSAATTVSCPNGTLEITKDVSVVALDGPCENLVVSASTATVIGDTVGTLTVSGSVNTVWIESADKIVVTGDTNTVDWVSGSPEVTDDGDLNAIGLMKGN